MAPLRPSRYDFLRAPTAAFFALIPDPIVKQPSSILLAADFSARAQFVFSLALSKEREQSAVRRGAESVPSDTATSLAIGRPRQTALHCGVFNPWGPASLWSRSRGFRRSGGCKERALGVCLTPGGRIQGLPGSRLRIVTAGAAPHSRQFRLQTSLKRTGILMKLYHG
jgi:hypothetical protein